jgi:serine acetyltransferase
MKLVFIPDKDAYLKYLENVLQAGGVNNIEWQQISEMLVDVFDGAFSRFSCNRSRYLTDPDKGETYLRAWHYSSLVLVLHALARQLYLTGSQLLSEKVYFSQISHTSCDIYYEVALPLRTSCDHPLGAVIGRGTFGPNSSLQFSSGCNIGNNNSIYPEIEGNLLLLPSAALVGKTIIKGNVVLGRGAYVKDAGVIQDKLVFGTAPNNIFKEISLQKFASLSMFT